MHPLMQIVWQTAWKTVEQYSNIYIHIHAVQETTCTILNTKSHRLRDAELLLASRSTSFLWQNRPLAWVVHSHIKWYHWSSMLMSDIYIILGKYCGMSRIFLYQMKSIWNIVLIPSTANKSERKNVLNTELYKKRCFASFLK